MAARLEKRLLGGERVYTRDRICELAGVSVEQARRYWRAMGFPDVGDDTVAFTEADLEALRRLLALEGEGVLDHEFALSITRALGHTQARLVEWQVQALLEDLMERRWLRPRDASLTAVALAGEHLDDWEHLLVYAWRRQLAAVTGRALLVSQGRDDAAQEGWRTVGFADLVSYTRLSQRMDERALGRLVSRFERLSHDTVAGRGGRVVKTIGDEVLFVADRAEDAAAIALDLAETMARDPVLPDVRVGLATGGVVSRLGDVFGRTVNLASRLTALAQPGTVLCDRATAAQLADAPGLELDRERVRAVRGWGLVEPVVLRRAAPADGAPG
ncbi:adenylate/guanylate cyclase domain-containing protein [Vallicoccus soli]|uniref:Adenylate/guanylate cyclase domain-containing protein n=1 Tax=Vallicoccus soli TaxID=2339232 RepID=A0A3A3YYY7_9ACTN|nr:adenylate/guanylate cyclase domain-containing protein [Vallicoccus soli]